MFFFVELCILMEEAANRPDCKTFKRELGASLNWVNFKKLAKDDVFDPGSILSDPAVFLGPDHAKLKNTYLSAPAKVVDPSIQEAPKNGKKGANKKATLTERGIPD
jgi:hypothetical protein